MLTKFGIISDIKVMNLDVKWKIKRSLSHLYDNCRNKAKTLNDTRILYYHSISDKYIWSVLPEQFEKQMKYIANNHEVVPLDSLLSNEMKVVPSEKKRIIISFDDGWEDNYSCAFPILKHYNLCATFFVTTKLITGEIYIKNMEGMKSLTMNQIVEMNHSGMNFGSHTCTHPNLCEIDSNAIKYELLHSKKMLEEILGFEVNTFCYPRGFFNSRIIELVKKTGYKLACATSWGGCDSETNPFILPRVRIEPQDRIQDFIGKIEGDWDYVKFVRFVRDKFFRRL